MRAATPGNHEEIDDAGDEGPLFQFRNAHQSSRRFARHSRNNESCSQLVQKL